MRRVMNGSKGTARRYDLTDKGIPIAGRRVPCRCVRFQKRNVSKVLLTTLTDLGSSAIMLFLYAMRLIRTRAMQFQWWLNMAAVVHPAPRLQSRLLIISSKLKQKRRGHDESANLFTFKSCTPAGTANADQTTAVDGAVVDYFSCDAVGHNRSLGAVFCRWRDWSPWAWKHMIRIGVGFVMMVIIATIPIWHYRTIAPLGWIGAVIVLAVLEFIGGGNGVQRWLSIGGFNLQPSEPAKLAVIMLMAAYFHSINPELIRNIRTYIPAFIIALVPFVQVMLQPDLGTSIMLLGAAAAVIFVAGMPGWMIGTLTGLVIAAVPVIWSSLYQYQKNRILVFLNPGLTSWGQGIKLRSLKLHWVVAAFLAKDICKAVKRT